MSDETQPDNPPASPAHTQPVSPDTLMSDFRGKPIVAIVIFTLIAHGLFIGVFSLGYLRDQVLGEDTSSLSEDERMDIALDEGTKALREIAERHNLSVQDLSNRSAKARDTRARPGSAISSARRTAYPPSCVVVPRTTASCSGSSTATACSAAATVPRGATRASTRSRPCSYSASG